jgi:SSS family solute:Na+ symporter
MIFASLAATIIGPGFSVGFTTKGYSTGYVFYWLVLAYSVQTILVGLVFAPRLATFRNCHTIGDVFNRCYGKFSHLLAGIVSVGLCIGFTSAFVTMFVALLTFSGGIRAVIANDGAQFIWFSIIIPVTLLTAVFKNPGPAQEVAARATELTNTGFAGMTGAQILGIVVSFLLGETLTPPFANRALAAKDESASRKGFVYAGLYVIVWLGICTTLGIYAHQYIPADTKPDDVFLGIGRMLLHPALYGALIVAIIAVVMSSQESLLNSASVAFVRDILSIRGKLSDQSELLYSRMATIVIAVIAVVVAQYSPSIIEGLLICYSIWAPSILIPLLIGLYVKDTRSSAGWLSMLCGASTSIIWQTILKEPSGIPAILVGLAASATGYAIGHFWGSLHIDETTEVSK